MPGLWVTRSTCGMLSAAYQKTSKNAVSPGEPVKLMIQIDFCTKQREERIGFCIVQGTVYFTIWWTIIFHLFKNGQTLHPKCGVSLGRIWAPARKIESALISYWLTKRTIKGHVANQFTIIITSCVCFSFNLFCRNTCELCNSHERTLLKLLVAAFYDFMW